MATPYRFFTFIIIIQIFYAIGITAIVYALSGFSMESGTTTPFESVSANLSSMTSQIEGSTQRVFHMPLIDTGALVFYTGNIILDLILNFFTALPSMVTLLVTGFTHFFSLEATYVLEIKIFLFLIISVVYILQLIAFIMQIRGSGGKIT